MKIISDNNFLQHQIFLCRNQELVMDSDCKIVNTESTFKFSEHNQRCFYFTYIRTHYTLELTKGIWKFELWGAAGGRSDYYDEGSSEGYGAYVSGVIRLEKAARLYGFVGGKGENGTTDNIGGYGGFNGGGDGAQSENNGNCPSGGGGGSTDIRLFVDDLYSRIIVAAGGGSPGCSQQGGKGGDGGTIAGFDGDANIMGLLGGKGGSESNSLRFGDGEEGDPGFMAGGAGGGGYFGGSGGSSSSTLSDGLVCYHVCDTTVTDHSGGSGGGGGSSYVSGCEKCQTLNRNQQLIGPKYDSVYYFTEIEMIPGNGIIKTISINGYTAHKSHGLIKISRYGSICEKEITHNHRKSIAIFLERFVMFFVKDDSSIP